MISGSDKTHREIKFRAEGDNIPITIRDPGTEDIVLALIVEIIWIFIGVSS